MSAIRTVLLDLDGTLLDTREWILLAYEHAFRSHGLPLVDRAVLTSQIGRPLEVIYAELAGHDLEPSLTEAHRAFQGENAGLSRPFPGALEAVRRLHGAGMALGAVTSRSQRTSRLTIDLAGMARYFGAVVSAEDAPALKPDPAPLRVALERLGRGAAGAAMVGDTSHDVLAGRALGLLTVAATYGNHGRGVLDSAPDRHVDDVAELPAVLGLRA